MGKEVVLLKKDLPRRTVAATTSWIFGAAVQDHRADVLECPPAELAGEITGNIAVERLVVATVRIAYACVQKKRPQARVLLPAVHAVERAVGVALEQGVIAPSARMACTGVKEKRPRVSIRLSAVFAVLAHCLNFDYTQTYALEVSLSTIALAQGQFDHQP